MPDDLNNDKLHKTGQFLEQNGWEPGHVGPIDNCDRIWFKRFPEATQCHCNENPLQLAIKGSHFSTPDHDYTSLQIELIAECSDGEWIEFKVYGLSPETVEESLDIHVQKLLTAWEAIQ